MQMRSFMLLMGLQLLCCTQAQLSPNFTAYIVTRDGIKLKTDVYFPNSEPPHNTIYEKTPYNADGLAGEAAYYVALGYAYMGQDCRGRYNSGGNYSFWRTSGNDTIDTLNWLINNQTWSTGHVSLSGISADAIAQYVDVSGLTDDDAETLFSSVVTAFLVVGQNIMHQTTFQGGAYREALVTKWLDALPETEMVTTVLEHEAFDSWWYPIEDEYNNVWQKFNIPMLHFAGWYDIFSTNQIRTVIAINETSNSHGKGQQILFIDAGGHCAQGAITWPENALGLDLALTETVPKLMEYGFNASNNNNNNDWNVHDIVGWNIMFYMLGPGDSESIGNFWLQSESFPPFTQLPLYLYTDSSNKHKLLLYTPTSNGKSSFDYNPFNPMGTYGGNNLMISPCGPQNQKSTEDKRSDLIQFDSDAIGKDVYIVIMGEIIVNLFVTSNAVDTDFSAKLIDIYPDGKTEMLVQDSIFRMRWRDGYPFATSKAANISENDIYNISINIGYMAYIFNPGHSIRLTISSSNYPRFSVNYNSGLNVIDGNVSATSATNTIYFGSKYPSKVILPEIDLLWVNQRKVNVTQKLKNINKNFKMKPEMKAAVDKIKNKLYAANTL